MKPHKYFCRLATRVFIQCFTLKRRSDANRGRPDVIDISSGRLRHEHVEYQTYQQNSASC